MKSATSKLVMRLGSPIASFKRSLAPRGKYFRLTQSWTDSIGLSVEVDVSGETTTATGGIALSSEDVTATHSAKSHMASDFEIGVDPGTNMVFSRDGKFKERLGPCRIETSSGGMLERRILGTYQ